jgi:GGDEF domain-containing protein
VPAEEPAAEPEPEIVAEVASEEPAVASPEPDFDRFLGELVTEFESQPEVYAPELVEEPTLLSLPETAQVKDSSMVSEVTPLPTMSSEPVLPVLELEPESSLIAEEAVSNVEEFTPNLDIPLGMHPVSVLQSLHERKEPLTGLVVSIGINEYEQIHENLGRAAAEELLRSVDGLMTSLAEQDGFCTRRSMDEFILIFPRMAGAAAQRRLSELSERLWDFQLRNLGTFSVVFSWGATEAVRQPLADALGAATERMVETQNNRKSATMDRGRRRRATA